MYDGFESHTPVFVGELGEYVKEKLEERNRLSYAGCKGYDEAFLTLHALDFCIRRGLNPEIGSNLNRAIRLVKVVGCTGQLYISHGFNDRVIETYYIN